MSSGRRTVVTGGDAEVKQAKGHHGLFDGFGAYQTPTDEDYRLVLSQGMVVPDANVLLNLYRYTEQARTDLLSALSTLGNKLWVPHQVLTEFWRNRESTLADARSTSRQAANELSSHLQKTINTIRTWANHVALADEDLERLQAQLKSAYTEARELVERIANDEWQGIEHDTNSDPVIVKLVDALERKVGEPFGDAEYPKFIKEGLKRIDDKVPPGYMDKSKEGDRAAADYLVWEQVLQETSRRACDVLFVTADMKEDWWRKERGFNRGPRHELAEELRERGGRRLFMLSPKQFLETAARVLQVQLQEGSVEDLERVERIRTEDATGAWTLDALRELLNRLSYEGYSDRVAVIRWAAKNSGFADRDAVYEICNYEEGRQLKGFTRPVNRLAGVLRDNGTIPEDAIDVMSTEYEPGEVQAAGFSVSPLIIPLLLQLDQQEGQ